MNKATRNDVLRDRSTCDSNSIRPDSIKIRTPLNPVNPFATRFFRAGAIPYRANDISISQLIDRWKEGGCVGAIVGGHGTGKSTLLLELGAELTRQGWRCEWVTIRKNKTHQSFIEVSRHALTGTSECPSDDQRRVAIVDGLDVLSWVGQVAVKNWYRRCRTGLLVSRHRSSWWIRTIHHTRADESLFVDLVKRLQSDQGWPESRQLVEESDAKSALIRHGGNLREAFFELYDLFADRFARLRERPSNDASGA